MCIQIKDWKRTEKSRFWNRNSLSFWGSKFHRNSNLNTFLKTEPHWNSY
jgi:hypothetical protein